MDDPYSKRLSSLLLVFSKICVLPKDYLVSGKILIFLFKMKDYVIKALLRGYHPLWLIPHG